MSVNLALPAFVESPAMLGWLAAASAPLIIHLLNRRKFRETSWAAMQFLLAAVRKNSRRIQIEQWLLLALRTLLIVLFVVAAARPGLKSVGLDAPVGERTHRILVIDSSFSMDYKPTGDASYFRQAVASAKRIVDAGREGDVFGIVVLGSPSQAVTTAPLVRREEVLTLLGELVQQDGAGDLTSCLNEIDRVIAATRDALPQVRRREVHFLTDLGRHTWEPNAAAGGADPLDEFQKRAERWGRETTLAIVDLGAAEAENTAVVDLAAEEPFAVAGMPVTLRVTVKHFGRNPRAGVTATLSADRRRLDEKQFDLDAGGETTLVFDAAAAASRGTGGLTYEVELSPDRLAADDRRRLVLEVKPHLSVLLVHEPALSPDAEFALSNLETALRLKPGAEDLAESPIRVTSADETELRGRDLHEFDAVVCVDVRRFSTDTLRRLHAYVHDGGGLICFLGPRVDVEHYNRQLARGDERILPAQIGPLVEDPQYRLNPLKYEHPLLAEFRGREQGGLFNTPIYRFYRLDLQAAPRARRVLEFLNATKDPLLVEEPIGAGRSLVWASSLEKSWTPMTLVSPGFVPVVQEMLSYALGGRAQRRTPTVGDVLEGTFRRTTATAQVSLDVPTPAAVAPAAPSDDDGAASRSAAPTATAEVAPQGENYRWSYADTQLSGIYTAHISGPPPTVERFAVNVDPRESDPVKLAANRLTDRTWTNVRFAYGTDVQDFSAAEATSIVAAADNPLHRWLLGTAIAAALVETWWAGRIGRRRL